MIDNIVEILRLDEVCILPTDTLYGLAANAYSEIGVKKVFDLKKRPYEKALPVHYHSFEAALADVEYSALFEKLAKAFWPGALTIVVPKKKDSKLVFAGETVAARVPNNKLMIEILEKLQKPLVMPSANISEEVPEATFAKIQAIFNVAGIEDDAAINNKPSTIIEISNEIKLIRSGLIPFAKILEIL